MRRGARQGLWRITSRRPDEHDVDEAVYRAFTELETKGPDFVTSSLIGFARRIAYRRGQDLGRVRNRDREMLVETEVNWERLDATTPADEKSPAEEAEREDLFRLAAGCMDTLTDGQRQVVEATIMGDQSLSDWGVEHGVTHQAASRTRQRAIEALKRCIAMKQELASEGTHDKEQESTHE